MKTLIIGCFTLLSLQIAAAGIGGIAGGSNKDELTINHSWEEIQKTIRNSHHKYEVKGYAIFLGRILSVFNVCQNGDMLRSLRQYPKYERQRVTRSRDNDGERDGWAKVEVGKEFLNYPIVYESFSEKCNNRGNNCRRVPKLVEQDVFRNISVHKVLRNHGGSRNGDRYKTKELFKKPFEVPVCD